MRILWIALLALFVVSCEKDLFEERDSYLVTDSESFEKLKNLYGDRISSLHSENGQTVFLGKGDDIRNISFDMHRLTDRCGGFFAFDTMDDATGGIFPRRRQKPLYPQINYTITKQQEVELLTDEVNPNNIADLIATLSNYKNRYYRSPTGVASQEYLKKTWESLNKRAQNFEVELYQHSSWPQPSVMATWTGSETPNEIVVLGGHGDSINVRGSRDNNMMAPGADDNASGVSTITEVIRVLMDSNYNPKRTIKFFAYAAEEVGLRGSRDLAKTFNKEKVNVVSAMQLDMTNHVATDGVISFIRDHTNDKLSLFVQKLADMHLDVKWVDDKCGYACSDHASWTAEGYPAVFPFEARFHTMNKKIHTANDTLAFSDSTAEHASHFAKLAIAYAVEVAK
jgi:leucyl aminopeptidase